MFPSGPPWPPPQQPRRPEPGTSWQAALLIVGTALVGLWIVAGTSVLQFGGWFVADLVDATGGHVTGTTWTVLAVLNAVLVAVPTGVIWLLTRFVTPPPVAVRECARAWTVAGVAGGMVGTARAVPLPHNELLLLLTALAAGLCSWLFLRPRVPWGMKRQRPPSSLAPSSLDSSVQTVPAPGRSGAVWWAITAGLASLLAWLWAGALGGLTETILAAVAAAAVGWLAATILDGGFFAAFGRSRLLLVLVGGTAAGVALVPLGAAAGGRGVNLAVLVVVPALGVAAAALAALATPQRLGRTPIAVMVGLAALGPLAFVDPEETSLVLGFTDVGYWTVIAAFLSVLAGLVVSLGYGLTLRPGGKLARLVTAAVTAVAVFAAAGVYVFAGRPGLFGERLFVVMTEQADLSGLDAIEDRDERLKATYDRLVQHARRTQAPLLDELRRWRLPATPYYLVNGVLVDGGPLVRQWLSTRSDVDRVLLDPRLRPLPVGTPTHKGEIDNRDGGPEWNITMIGADRAWAEGARGQGIVVGTSDSGVDGAHPDLRAGFRGGDDSWLDPWNGTTTPTDHGGHGTHTMGTVLGRNGIGVAPQAQWVGCVNLDRNAASPSRYLDCLQFMLAPHPPGADPFTAGRPDRAPHVLTNSWGCPGTEGCDLESLRPAIAALRAAGIFFVAAAGNTGPGCGSVDDPPAPYRDAFTVGAVDERREVAFFSSRGPTPDGAAKPDVVAPGVGILSSLPGGYGRLDGTSMATPHVAGVVALMWSANPDLIGQIGQTEEILRETATTVRLSSGEPSCGGYANVAGAGMVNADEAVRATRRPL